MTLQDNARKIVKQLSDHSGTINKLAIACDMPNSTLYDFINRKTDKLSERDAEKLLIYASKFKLKIKMRDLRPHMSKFS